MNEKLKEAIAEMIVNINDGVVASTAFLSAELPDYIHQLLMWVILKDSMIVAISFTIVWLSYTATFKWVNQELEYGMWPDEKLYTAVISAFISSISILCAIYSFFEIVKISIAPKVWLFEYAATLVK